MFEVCGSDEKGLRILMKTSHYDERDMIDLLACKAFIMKMFNQWNSI